ncbi:ABC transporter permease [Pseudomonas veronii]|jgi:ABC-2 type transport system permease protein|uniref:ABC transporter permease n=1 Tax=Pseudomonas TaxID=286 RepID=UPI00089BABFE|nr:MULTISPECIES: ABC transporter permease [Pseudomonas]SEC41345.1 ABC-2 type transport system permease protein [Pseudomonas marginalis]MCT8960792.1 ABC transporter permease [Pseudomonas veronii]MCT9823698.1 ABC transporter permease [Pseudomonas veronii]NWC58695.1 ABC transporter permease [Pseudomonas veronii]PUB37549.1 ABC-2 type transport system permease protein [Pseudomonas sp. GV105]
MNRLLSYLNETFAVCDAEVRKLIRDPTELLSRAIQPVLWLAVFGQVFSQVRGIPTGNLRYLDFMAPGILAQSILFSAIFYGIAIIWERDLGIVHKLLVTPAHRSALIMGKAFAAGLRGLVQAAVVYLVAIALHVEIRWELMPILTVAAGVFVGSCIFSTFSLVIACIVKTRERFMGIGQVLTMPLFFASNAIYPLELMPGWLKVIAVCNPLTYLVDALRSGMIVGGTSVYALTTSFAVMLSVFTVLLLLAARLYPGLAR